MCDTCPLDWPDPWPTWDLTVPDGTEVRDVAVMELDALLLSGGP